MSIAVNHHRTSTGENLATFRITVRVTADEIATAIMSHTSACFTHEPVEVTEDLIRTAVEAMFDRGLEMASYECGDNEGSGENPPGVVRHAVVKSDVVDLAFGGEAYWEGHHA